MAGIDRACNYPLIRLVRLCLLKSAEYGKLGQLPEHSERADGSAILVLIFEARVITVKFPMFVLERAA